MRLCSAAPGAQKIHKNTHDHENTVREPRWTPRESSAMALCCQYHHFSFTTYLDSAPCTMDLSGSTVRKTRPEGDRRCALRGARRNADRRKSGSTHAPRAYCPQLPQRHVLQYAGSWPATSCVDRRADDAPAPRRSSGIYSNLDRSSKRVSTWVPCPSHRDL
jgi:hypothetical protein